MTELAKELIKEKIAQCAEALLDLQKYQKVGTIDYLRAHPDTYYAVCYRFIGAIESLFDIGQFLLASKEVRAESQRDIPARMAQAGMIDAALAEQFITMYGFRNRLVHAYGSLDDAKVTEYLADHLVDIETLLRVAQKRIIEE